LKKVLTFVLEKIIIKKDTIVREPAQPKRHGTTLGVLYKFMSKKFGWNRPSLLWSFGPASCL